jgi:hypothetical protein
MVNYGGEMFNPIKQIMIWQLQMFVQSLSFSKQMLETMFSLQPASPVSLAQFKLGKVGCVGPADLQAGSKEK